ncbi:MAG: late competence development ComFB family protein [Spirochaetaceae bacterium]|nr:late competence development ComFB family protein [Spirochaetaceae bacterium]
MKLHNLLEEIVEASVNEYFNSLAEDNKADCVCEQCRLDTMCYVLNNMLPKYTASTRGIIHHKLEYTKKIQLEADILYLVKKGFSIVSQRKRVSVNFQNSKDMDIKNCPYHNFPNIIGKVINGTTFEPIPDAEIALFMDDIPVQMTSNLMENPVKLNHHVRGMFTFWPYPVEAEKIGDEKTFKFKITVNHPDFNEFIKLVEITTTAEENFLTSIQLPNIKTLEDIFIFPREE